MAKSQKSSARSQKSLKSSNGRPRRSKRQAPLTRKNLARHNRAGSSASSVITAVDSRILRHIPPPMSLGPYTVVRSRIQSSIFTSAGGHMTTYLVGAHSDQSLGTANCMTPLLAIGGTGLSVPGASTDLNVTDSQMQPYGGNLNSSVASAALHSLTVVVNCLDSAQNASGQVFMGTLSNRVARSNFGTWNELASSLYQRREMKPRSAYSTMASPYTVVSAPLDVTDWCLHRPLVSVATTQANNVTIDTLAPIAVIFPPTATIVEYSMSIYAEWRVNFHQPLLASTHQAREPSSHSLWSTASRLVNEVGGDVAGFVGNASGAVGPILSTLDRLGSVADGLGHLAGAAKRW